MANPVMTAKQEAVLDDWARGAAVHLAYLVAASVGSGFKLNGRWDGEGFLKLGPPTIGYLGKSGKRASLENKLIFKFMVSLISI